MSHSKMATIGDDDLDVAQLMEETDGEALDVINSMGGVAGSLQDELGITLDPATAAAVKKVMNEKRKEATTQDMNRRNLHYQSYLVENAPGQLHPQGYQGAGLDPMEGYKQPKGKDPVVNLLNYSALDSEVFKGFLATRKNRHGNMCSLTDVRKYFDALNYGRSMAKTEFKDDFEDDVRDFLKSYSKSYATAREKGEVSEQTSDAMNARVFRFLCEQAIKEGRIFFWAWITLQWHLMCRSANVGSLQFKLFGLANDAMCAQFAKTKAGQSGELCNLKHIYANPLEPSICPFLALGVLLASTPERSDSSHAVFEGKEQSTRFNKQLTEMLGQHRDELLLKGMISADSRLSCHGIRKGASNTAASGTTAAPPIVAICLRQVSNCFETTDSYFGCICLSPPTHTFCLWPYRADWKLGRVLQIYFQGEAAGDQYVGRTVALLPINSADFAVLPPHFGDDTDADVISAIKEVFGDIYLKYPHFRGNLTMMLASIIHHYDFLKDTLNSEAKGSSPFFGCALFQDQERFQRLRSKATINAGDTVMQATGVPPHVFMLGEQVQTQQKIDVSDSLRLHTTCFYPTKTDPAWPHMQDLLTTLNGIVPTMTDSVVSGVKRAFEQDSSDRGVISISSLKQIMVYIFTCYSF